jgi:serine/threonine-protein kinase
MAPEQALGSQIDGRADVYAVGVVLYELLVGRRPFSSDDMFEVLRLHREVPPAPIRTVLPEAGFSAALDAAVMKALAKEPDERFQSATAFAAALVATPEGTQGLPAPEPRADRGVEGERRGTPRVTAPTRAFGSGHRDASGGVDPSLYRRRQRLRRGLLVGLPLLAGAAAVGIWFHLDRREPSSSAGRTAHEPAIPPAPTRVSEPEREAEPPSQRPRAIAAAAETPRGTSTASTPAETAPRPPQVAEELDGTAPSAAPRTTPPSTAPPPSPAGAGEPTVNLAEVERLIADGRHAKAIPLLLRLRSRHPRDPVVAYTLGNCFAEKLWWADALVAYRAAIRLKPAYRSDPTMIRHMALALIGDGFYRRAGQFLVEDVGPPAKPVLAELAARHKVPKVRQRAAALLAKL